MDSSKTQPHMVVSNQAEAVAFNNWLSNPQTKKFVAKLEEQYQAGLEAMLAGARVNELDMIRRDAGFLSERKRMIDTLKPVSHLDFPAIANQTDNNR